MVVRAHVFVTGRVQGVSYRWWTSKKAKQKGLKGWVKNLSDGRVEAVFEGTKDKVKEMIKECKNGSFAADVDKIDIEWEEPEKLENFDIKY